MELRISNRKLILPDLLTLYEKCGLADLCQNGAAEIDFLSSLSCGLLVCLILCVCENLPLC